MKECGYPVRITDTHGLNFILMPAAHHQQVLYLAFLQVLAWVFRDFIGEYINKVFVNA